MDQNQVAAILSEIGTLLELQGENAFRCNAYHNAARAIQQLEMPLADLVAADKLRTIPGIGETLREKITALVTTGKLKFYDDLRAPGAMAAQPAATTLAPASPQSGTPPPAQPL